MYRGPPGTNWRSRAILQTSKAAIRVRHRGGGRRRAHQKGIGSKSETQPHHDSGVINHRIHVMHGSAGECRSTTTTVTASTQARRRRPRGTTAWRRHPGVPPHRGATLETPGAPHGVRSNAGDRGDSGRKP